MNQLEVEVIDSTELAKRGYARGPTQNVPAIQSRISGLGATFVFLGEARSFASG